MFVWTKFKTFFIGPNAKDLSEFEKQINKVKKLEQKVLQEDVKRMRIGEIENLKSQREKKLEELEEQKNVKSSFEILGVMEIR